MLGMLKAFTGLGGIVILLIGLMMLGVTIWAFTQAALTFNNYTFLGILLGADFVIIFAAVLGIIGVKRQNGILLFIFQIFVMIFFCAFLGLGIAAQVLPKEVFNGNCTESSNQLIKIAHNAYETSNVLCLPGMPALSCACDLRDSSIQNGGYNPVQQSVLKGFNRTSGGALKFQSCPIAQIYPYNQDNYTFVFGVLTAIEQSLDCSNWCNNGSLFYKFSDVNRGLPQANCYDTMKDKLNRYGGIIGIFSFGSAFFMLLVCICGLCVCCAPSRKGDPLASRFIVNDGGYYRPVR